MDCTHANAMDLPQLKDFFAKRQRLIGELQQSARSVSAWWAECANSDPTLQDLALLEGLLAERKRLLNQMVQLDDDMLTQLVTARAQSRAGR